MSGLELGVIGGGISALATTTGAFFILAKNSKFGKHLEKINMDFVIGLMLSAAAFSLILPAYESRSAVHQHIGLGFLSITCALLFGVLFIQLTGKFVDSLFANKISLKENKKAILFVIAMMVHNFPEGLASGSSMTLPGTQGYSLLSAIAIQNFPEGFTTAVSFMALGLSPWIAFLGALMTAFVELFGGMLGGYLSFQIEGILPYFMAFAGGAMMHVVLVELFEKIKNEKSTFLFKPGFLSGVGIVLLMKYI